MSEGNWKHETKYTVLIATPETQESFRAAMREQLAEDYGEPAPEEEVEEMAAFAWLIRAKELCAKADVLYEEGVSAEEVRRIVKIEPQPSTD